MVHVSREDHDKNCGVPNIGFHHSYNTVRLEDTKDLNVSLILYSSTFI
jgi:hypothetical protein